MPTRILLRLFLLAGLAAPLCAFALGVGQLEVRSSLNQIFEAEIPLIISNPAELTGLTVRLPRQQDFDRAGVERLELLSKLRLSVRTPPGGPNVIKVTSVEPIREPNFNLLLELTWPRGRLIREFPVQLDPELYANRRPPPLPSAPIVTPPPIAVAPPVQKFPATPVLPPAPPVSFKGASFYGPVKPGETLAAVARRVRPSPAVNVPQMMAILIAGNPEAFANGNPNTLRAGATLKVPNPQAMGMMGMTGTPATPPAAPGLAVITPPPVEPTAPEPPIAPLLEPAPVPAPPPLAAEPPAPPATATAPQIPSASQPETAPPPFLSPAEQPREIVPQASIPQPVESPPPVASTMPEPAPMPAVAPPQQPAPATKPPAPQPVVDNEISWMSNPVVWVAIALIVLAIGSVLLLPLLRRPARPKILATTAESAAAPADSGTAEVTTTRTQIREPRSARSQPIAPGLAAMAAGLLRGAAPTPQPTTRLLLKDHDEAGPASKPVVTPAPKPIGELLKDMDFGLNRVQTAVASNNGTAPDIKAPLFEAEPPTASITRRPVNPFAAASPGEPATKPVESSPFQAEELPSELRLDGMDFDFGDLGLEKTARPQPVDLPPLEMGRGALDSKPIPPPSPGFAGQKAAAPLVKPAPPALQDLKFEFADVTQEYGKSGGSDDPLRLDAELQDFGGDTLSLGKMAVESGGRAEASADYVETKLDLATAYLDMGDQVGARSLLDDVLNEGDAAQKQRAGALLKQLG